jgi:hypothetical protein
MQTSTICALTACAIAAYAQAQAPCDSVRVAPPLVVPPVDFGGGVAVDGDFWFIADTNARLLCPGPFGCGAGAVHVYEMADGQLYHRQMLTAPTPRLGDFFGSSIDAEAGRVIIASNNSQWPGTAAKGGAFIFEFDGEQWAPAGELSPPDGIPVCTREFGGLVALEGESAYLRPAYCELVLRYTRRGGVWEFDEAIEVPEGEPTGSLFGVPVVADREWVFLGASDDSSIVHRGGAVYAYRRAIDGSLTLSQKIMPTDVPSGAEATQLFGRSISFDGETLAIGAIGARRPESSAGAVLLYELTGGQWTLRQEVTHSPSEAADAFGWSVLVQGDVLLASASGQGTPTTSSSLHLLRRDMSGNWAYDSRLVPDVPIYARYFAGALALNGTILLAGAPDDSDGTSLLPGAAYLFDLTCTDCPPDLDADGALTVFDFLTYLNLFQDGDPLADFDGDGELTIFDFLAFQTAFDAGCA